MKDWKEAAKCRPMADFYSFTSPAVLCYTRDGQYIVGQYMPSADKWVMESGEAIDGVEFWRVLPKEPGKE